MNISEKISQSDFQELLIKIYQKENELKEVEIRNVIEEIKQNILLICNSNK